MNIAHVCSVYQNVCSEYILGKMSWLEQQSKRYHKEDLRQTLLAEARRHLIEVGADALSLREIARRAQVSPRAPYRHFESKDALLAAIAAEGFQALTQEFKAVEAPEPRERLRQMAKIYVQFARKNPAVFRLMFSPVLQLLEPEGTAMIAFEQLVSVARDLHPPESGLRHWTKMATALWSGLHGIATISNDGAGELYGSEVFIEPEALVDAIVRGWQFEPQN